MTTIRRITVSQVTGNDSNADEINEIRPFGEIGVYVNEDNNTEKPELLLFDGIRTHIKSKVLAPGVFYGSGADSGDGLNLDTIKLIPDAALFRNNGSYGNDQYIIVDPTEPNHIHLRAGGTQDSSGADLYLGGEQTFVRVSDTYDNVVIRTSTIGEGIIPHSWTFDNNGDLTFPGSSNARIGDDEPGLVVYSENGFAVQTNANNINNYEVEFTGYVSNGFGDSAGATLTVTGIISGTITDGMTIYGSGLPPEGWTLTFGGAMEPQGSGGTGNYLLSGANILTSSQSFNNGVAAAGSQSWIFGTDGNLTFPDATTQTSAFVQGEQIFTLDTGATDYAPTAVDFNLLFVTPAIGYSSADPISVTLPNGIPGQRLIIFNGYSLATLTVNPGILGRDISSGVVAEFIYSGFDGLWIPLYGTNSPT